MKFTKEQLAALAAGQSMEEVLAMIAKTDPAASAQAEGAPAAGSLTGQTQDVKEVKEVKASAEQNEAVQALTEQLIQANASSEALSKQVEELKAQVETLTAQASQANADADYLKEVAIKGVASMSIGLGAKKDVSAASVSEIVAAHKETSEKFSAAFKSGASTKNTQAQAVKEVGKFETENFLARARNLKV